MTGIATTKNLTVLGILMIIQALGTGVGAFFDGDPTTNVDLGLIISSVIAGVGMIFAKGSGTTGVQTVGGKPVTPAP